MMLPSIIEKLFPLTYQLIPGTSEIFELNFALWEYENLSTYDLVNRSAYFKMIDGVPTIHYQLCNLQNLDEIHKYSSLRTKAYYQAGKYSIGYATHSLFPYKGKFHPQMIKALLNAIGMKPGNIVLDPMSGSATLSVEANLLGIDSIGIDISPFCCLMGRVKTFALDLSIEMLEHIAKDSDILTSIKEHGYKLLDILPSDYYRSYYEIIILAYLDAMGFARRSNKSIDSLFPIVLNRYITTIKNFQYAKNALGLKIGKSHIIEGSAYNLPLNDNSIDGVITSPPYANAINYINNDKPQLEYMGCDIAKLKQNMIGLQGKGINEKLALYFDTMNKVFAELSRVTKKGSKTVFIVGSNNIQTKGTRLENKLIELALNNKFQLLYRIAKPIKGMQNTMKEEYILIFENIKQS